MLLGVGAAVAGARGGAGTGDAAMAAVMAPQSAMMFSLLSYQRQQEEQADKGGVKFLTATGQSAKGMYETFKRFADDELYKSQGMSPYMRSHPMSKERVAALTEIAKSSPYWDKKDPPELQLRHDLMRAKLQGYLERPDTVARRYPESDQSLPARYARAIAAYRFANIRGALAQIDGLIAAMPGNPYFYELKGQALLESGRPAEAIAPLRHAISIAPNPTLMQVMLAQALVATQQSGGRRRSDQQPAKRDHSRPGYPGRLQPVGDGVRTQGRLRAGGSCLGPGSLRQRRLPHRAPACQTRQDPVPGRGARLGQSRRYRRLQTAGSPRPSVTATDHAMASPA